MVGTMISYIISVIHYVCDSRIANNTNKPLQTSDMK